MNILKRFLIVFAGLALALPKLCFNAYCEELPLLNEAKSAILTEKETGKVLYEKNADEKLPIASVTKIMTLIIAAEEIRDGKLSLSDSAVCSDYAGSMDGSVIWLEAGEVMEVGELIKSIVIASANDACVMLAEHISGSETEFVAKMNEKAKELGMDNTSFKNCVGYDDPEHYSSARDISKMAAELRKYSYYDEYLLTRLDSVRTGTKAETQLLNTNKLITSYSGITGLKTGTTDNAGCCFCMTAKKNGMELVGVVLGCETDEGRFDDAEALVDYGFENYERVVLRPDTAELKEVKVEGGTKKNIDTRFSGISDVILRKGTYSGIEYHYSRTEAVTAPIEKGTVVGFVTMMSGDEVVGTAKIVSAETVEELSFSRCFEELLRRLFIF